MTCPVCGRPVDPAARACARCGAPLQTPATGPTAPGAVSPTGPAGATGSTGTDAWDTSATPVGAAPGRPARPVDEPLLVQRLSRPVRRPPEPRRAGALPIVLLSLLALVALAVGGYVLLTRDDGPPARQAAPPLPTTTATPSTPASSSALPSASPSATPSADAATTQAGGLDALVERSTQSRGAVAPAATALSTCTTTPAAALAVFEQAAAGRRSLLTQLGALPLDAVPEGAALRTGFSAVLTSSAAADDAFAAWARRQGGTCTPDPSDPDLVRGLQLSATGARPAKEAFVAQWNPVAARYGLPARAATAL